MKTAGESTGRQAAPCIALLVLLLFAGTVRSQGWELIVCAHPDNLPYSNRQAEGFENRIAELLAEELGAELRYVWLDSLGSRAREVSTREGDCDVVMGVNDGNEALLTTVAYYRSTYLFVYREDSPFAIESFDDAALRDLSIGVQIAGRSVSPVTLALANRDLLDNQVGLLPDADSADPLAGPVEAVAAGEVDVAVVWGPIAGYFADLQPVDLRLAPVSPSIEIPFVPLVASISIGVRPVDEALRDRLDLALAGRWDAIQAILARYRVPLLPLPAPGLSVD